MAAPAWALAIVKPIDAAHGRRGRGRERRSGKGSTFIVQLTLEYDPAGFEPAARSGLERLAMVVTRRWRIARRPISKPGSRPWRADVQWSSDGDVLWPASPDATPARFHGHCLLLTVTRRSVAALSQLHRSIQLGGARRLSSSSRPRAAAAASPVSGAATLSR